MPAANADSADSAVNNVFCCKKQPKAYNKTGNWRNEPQYFSKRQHNKHCRTDKGKYAKSNNTAFAEKYVHIKIKRAQLKTTRLRFKCFLDNAQQNPERIINSDAPLCCHK